MLNVLFDKQDSNTLITRDSKITYTENRWNTQRYIIRLNNEDSSDDIIEKVDLHLESSAGNLTNINLKKYDNVLNELNKDKLYEDVTVITITICSTLGAIWHFYNCLHEKQKETTTRANRNGDAWTLILNFKFYKENTYIKTGEEQ